MQVLTYAGAIKADGATHGTSSDRRSGGGCNCRALCCARDAAARRDACDGQGKQRIAPGFTGVAKFGEWRLICVPGPSTFDGLGPNLSSGEQGAPKTPAGNACRINQEMPAPESAEATRRVIIAANFSLVGPRHMPAAMLRLPATARPGDIISLRFEDQAVVNTMVRNCTATECLAAATLSPSDWAHLSDAKSLQVAFPALGRQWVLLNLPVDGLSAAMDALGRAATASH